MVDAVGSVAKIVQVALQIKDAVDTAKQNREECRKIGARVNRLRAVLSCLENNAAELTKSPATSDALEALGEILHRALKLVKDCQEEKNIVSRLFTARKLSDDLRQVNQAISDRMMDGMFAINVQVTIRLVANAPRAQVHGIVEGSHVNIQSDTINSYVEITIAEESEDASVLSYFRKFSLSEMEVGTNNFSEQNLIGEGSLAAVYKGVLPDGREVAIKRPCGCQYNLIFPVLFQHGNVVTSLGYCLYGLCEMVVEEYMPNGTLSEIINGSPQLDWPSTFRIIRGIAEGLAYLQTMCVVHADLKPDNILFDSDMNPKICGFERSKILLEQGVTEVVIEELAGTLGYVPPEYIVDGIISMKNDVFSFGVLIIRTISGIRRLALDQHPIGWAWKLRGAQGMKELSDPELSDDECQLKEMERCIDIGLLCAQEFLEDRPTMPDVLRMLNGDEMLTTPKKPGFIKE